MIHSDYAIAVLVAIYGSRPDGHARVIWETLLADSEHEVWGLLDDHPANASRGFCGLSVIGAGSSLPELASSGLEGVVLGFGTAAGRSAIADRVRAAGLSLPTLVHPTAEIARSAELAAGVTVMARAVIGPGVRLGCGVLINTAADVEHDAAVGGGAVIGPGAVVAGRAAIGDDAELGAGAIVLPDAFVGASAVIGAGAVVLRRVAGGETVVGVPARRVVG